MSINETTRCAFTNCNHAKSLHFLNEGQWYCFICMTRTKPQNDAFHEFHPPESSLNE